MAEVHHVLPTRENQILCETGKLVNPDDASGAALEDALSAVATRKCRSGQADEWELQKEAWKEYDPAFYHISTRVSALENVLHLHQRLKFTNNCGFACQIGSPKRHRK